MGRQPLQLGPYGFCAVRENRVKTPAKAVPSYGKGAVIESDAERSMLSPEQSHHSRTQEHLSRLVKAVIRTPTNGRPKPQTRLLQLCIAPQAS
jgi:hypothetical protein